MGVPAFFRWLSRKYPKIVAPVIESPTKDANGDDIPVDITQPNPNGEEFDNLYLDMNGIVHPCSHPEDRPPPRNEDEMMMEVFRYTDRVIAMVRPRKLLMIAVDGVAPRAKMNQQRSRRFRSAQEAEEKEKKKEEAIAEVIAGGGQPPEEGPKPWDSNVITPGTPFMDILAASLRYWIQYKLNNDPGWKNLKVIISDASVPGEGEHKIMEFIRSQRSDPAHDPNTRHVLYGLDADLIMLGLATHEPYFRVLREDVFFQQNNGSCRNCGERGHFAADCTVTVEKKGPDKLAPPKPFIWLNVAILREYLEAELSIPGQQIPMDLERAIDDWVFIIFFVGNDFLPHLPSLDIREGAIDTLVSLWKRNLDRQGGYITCDGTVDLSRAQHMLDGLAEQEESIFRRRQSEEERRVVREADRARQRNERAPKKPRVMADLGSADNVSINSPAAATHAASTAPIPATSKNKGKATVPEPLGLHDLSKPINGPQMSNKDVVANRKALRMGDASEANLSAAAKLKAALLKPTLEEAANEATTEEVDPPKKRGFGEFADDGTATPLSVATENEVGSDAVDPMADTVRLWEEGYKDRYYVQKFQADPENIAFRRSIARDYVEGLAWVLLYYYQGCPSWTWFYPHHYAPFASDFDQIADVQINFTKGEPARPYEQLLGVMPVASKHVLPEPLQHLMTDPEYGIQDFYPLDFPVDLNGKKFAWQGVVLLPFIDQGRLKEACAKGYELLSPEESARNSRGYEVLYFSEDNEPLYAQVVHKLFSKKAAKKDKVQLDMRASGGLAGKVNKDEAFIPNAAVPFPLKVENKWPDIESDKSMSVRYFYPKSKYVHKSMLLKGLTLPPRVLDRRDLDHVRYGTAPRNYQNNNDRYGNNNRSRDTQDPAAHQRAPSGHGQNGQKSGLPWQQRQQLRQQQDSWQGYGQPQQVYQPAPAMPFGSGPPPSRDMMPVPIPGFMPMAAPVSAMPPVPMPGQRQPYGAPYGQQQYGQQQYGQQHQQYPGNEADPYSRYQGGNGYSNGGQNGGQWQGYQH